MAWRPPTPLLIVGTAVVAAVAALVMQLRRLSKPLSSQAPDKDQDQQHHHGTQRRALFISLELGEVFSGNGIYAQTCLRGLLDADPTLVALSLSGRPAANAAPAGNVPAALRFHVREARCVLLSHPLATWGKLDYSSDWRGFRDGGAEAFGADVAAFQPTVVYAVDWHGAFLAAELLKRRMRADVPIIYLNFRTYHRNVAAKPGVGAEIEFYREAEAAAVEAAAVSVALCSSDKRALQRLRPTARVRVVHPPLREDLLELARAADTVSGAGGGERAQSVPESGRRRRWLLCAVRLSRCVVVAGFSLPADP